MSGYAWNETADVQLAAGSSLVQRLDVGELMDELEAAVIDLPLRQRVEHERVVRVGRVRQGNFLSHAGAPSKTLFFENQEIFLASAVKSLKMKSPEGVKPSGDF
jgi:hypothetical protein